MRYSDAAHVDTGSFYSRRPEHGKLFRLLGYAAIAAAWWHHEDPELIARLLVVLVVVWLVAWYRVVGTLWRSSVVAAIVLCAVILTMQRLHLASASHAVLAGSP